MSKSKFRLHPFYIENDCQLVEIPRGMKAPVQKGWPSINRTPDELVYCLGDSETNKFGWILGADHLVLDVDEHGKESGTESLAKLSSHLGISLQAACDCIVNTPSGGQHLVWLKDTHQAIRSISRDFPALDVITAPGRQIIGVGSEHDGHPGKLYEFVQKEPTLIPAPWELITFLAPQKGQPGDYQNQGSAGDLFQTTEQGRDLFLRELERHGYQLEQCGERVGFSRPGSTTPGPGGFVGWQSEQGVFLVNCHSLSDEVLVHNPKGHSLFHSLAALSFEGDYHQCGKWLRSQGFRTRALSAVTVDVPDVAEADRHGGHLISELLVEHPQPKPILIDGLLRESEIMNVIAAPKTGKSWMVMQLALAAATGRDWLGFNVARPLKVLYLDNELEAGTLGSRVQMVAKANGIHLDALTSIRFRALRGRSVVFGNLHQILDKIQPGECDLIVMDALYRLWNPGMSENDNAAVTQVYNQLDSIAAQMGAAIVLVHHTSKGSQSEKATTDVGSGAGALSRAADSHLTLREHQEEDHVVMNAVVRSFPPEASGIPGEGLTFRKASGIWHRAEDVQPAFADPQTKRNAAESQRAQKTLPKVLAEHPEGLRKAELREATGISRRLIDEWIMASLEVDLITQNTVGRSTFYTIKVGE